MAEPLNLKYGRYKILKMLGAGSMGIVYEAHDPQIDRRVALKVLRQDRLTSEAYTRRFLKEAVAIGRLSHPRIVTVYDAGHENNAVYIAMEFLEGEPLDRLMGKMRLDLTQALDLGSQVAEALDYAHSKGIVHRDVKPSNMLLRADGLVKITDFGIAHIDNPEATSQTQVGEILGTPAYMSPEQVQGKPVDGRSDLFSLGVILYELSTGEKPFKGQSITSILREIVEGTPRGPAGIRPDLPEDISAVVMKCLSKNPEDRYQTGKELAEALKGCMESRLHPVEAPPPPVARRRTGLLYIPAALVVAGLLAFGVFHYAGKNFRTSTGGNVAQTTLTTTTVPATTVPTTRAPVTTIPATTVPSTRAPVTTIPDVKPPVTTVPPAASSQPASASSAGNPAIGKEDPQALAGTRKPEPVQEQSTGPVLAIDPAGRSVDDRFRDSMQQGMAALEQKQFEIARQSFTRALSLKSDSEAYFQLLSSLMELQLDEQMRDTFDKAVSLFPDAPGLYEVYARHLIATGRNQEASRIMDRAFARLPDDATVQQWRDYIATLNKPSTADATVKILPPYPISSQRTRKNTAADNVEKARALFTLAQKENKKLVWDDCLAGKAFQRAKDMVAAGYFDHKTPQTAKNPAWALIASCRKAANAGENLTQGYHPAEAVHQELMKSSTHRKNILNAKFRYMGVGCSEYICVEFFAGP